MSEISAKVSVVIPAYNMAEYIDEAICSVLEGSFRDLEVIVIDDGSTDSTDSIVAKYTDPLSSKYDARVRYEYQKNKGKSSAVNHGLGIAKGAYVTILDADDQLTPSSLKARYECRFDNDGCLFDLVIGGFEVFDYSQTYGTRLPPDPATPSDLYDRFYLRWRTPFHLNAALISKRLIKEVGGLDETLHRCIDGDYALRLLKNAETLNIVNDVVYRYRKYRSSVFNRMRYRLKTARYRPKVVWKNYDGWRRWAAVPFGIAMDTGKLFYELVANYKS